MNKDVIYGLNNAGIKFNTFLLQYVFTRIETEEDRHIYNFVTDMMIERIGKNQVDNFLASVSDLLEQYSLGNIENVEEKGQTKKD